jgi:hypothetical protein
VYWDNIAPMIVGITLILTVGGVMVLRPIANRLGDLVEVIRQSRSDPALAQSLSHLAEVLESTNSRLEALEERQEFTESLLRGGSPGAEARRLAGGSTGDSTASGTDSDR